jgi:hypothetical protein
MNKAGLKRVGVLWGGISLFALWIIGILTTGDGTLNWIVFLAPFGVILLALLVALTLAVYEDR